MAEQVVIVVDKNSKTLLETAIKLKNIVGASKKCETALWGLKEYKDNEPTLTSSQKIIFFGENEISRLNISSINWKYVWKNLHYGWIGYVAMLYVSELSYSKIEMSEFKELCKKQNVEIKRMPEGSSSGDGGLIALGIIGFLLFPWLAIPALISSNEESNNLLTTQYSFLVNQFIMDGVDEYLKG
jgi:hypothetical protein